jgi:carbonic anhydrase
VPANEVTNTEPGEIFVHRNVANLVVNTDLNLLSVLQYAVDVLKVKHIIVCGHYGCGGVKAAMTQQSFGLINKWLRNIKDVYRFHRVEIDGIGDLEKRVDRLVELNVNEQIHNLAKTSIVQKAWATRQSPILHGWVYGLDDGILHEIITLDHTYNVDPIYRFEPDELKD